LRSERPCSVEFTYGATGPRNAVGPGSNRANREDIRSRDRGTLSNIQNTPPHLSTPAEPVFVTAHQATAMVGARYYTVVPARLAADAWQQTADGIQPLYLRSNVEAAMQPGGALDPARIRPGRPRRGQEARQATGPHRVIAQRRPVEITAEVEVAS
jgi:hypothetical protein